MISVIKILIFTIILTLEAKSQAYDQGTNHVASPSAVLVGQDARTALELPISPNDWFAREEPMPESVLREAFLGREHSAACTDAGFALQNAEELGPHRSLEDENRWYFIIREYVFHCLFPFENVSDPLGSYNGARSENSRFLLQLLSDSGVDKLSRSIVFTPGVTGQSCSGVLVWLEHDGRRSLYLATAAHCAGSIEASTEPAKRPIIRVFERLIFKSLSGENWEVTASNASSVLPYDPFGGDLAFVNLGDNFDDSIIGLELARRDAKAWEHLYIIGQNRYLSEFRLLQYYRSNGLLSVPADHAVVVDLGVGCRAFGHANGVVFHNCQTINGTSGAPVFLYDDGQLKVFALHSGNENAFKDAKLAGDKFLEIAFGSASINYSTVVAGR